MKFFKGVDISSLPEHLDGNEKFYTEDGRCVEAFDLLKENNINSIRLRIWNEPELVPDAKGYCNLEHTIAMAKKIKENQMHFMLDFHYSDYWADPGQQRKPKAWEELSFDELVEALYQYTKEVLETLKKENCLPDIVQVGNEIRSGLLFPDGAVPKYDNIAKLLNAGIQAVREVSSDIEVMIHLDQGGRYYDLKEWFDEVFAAGMNPIDLIGISYYSFWHGTFMDLKNSMEQLIARYKVPVYVVETAHPWRQCKNEHISADLMKTAGLPAGIEEQKKSLELVMQIAATASGDLPTGVYYWEPLCIPGKNYGSWDEQMGVLDDNGRALLALSAYKNFDPKNPPISNLEAYIESLYEEEDVPKIPEGINLVKNCDFHEKLDGWIVKKDPEDVKIQIGDGELYVSCKSNYNLVLSQRVQIESEGTYHLFVEYRGTNTTGVEVDLYAKSITDKKEVEFTKRIFPSDVRFVTHAIENLHFMPGEVEVGICMNTPPVFGRIRNMILVKAE